MKHPPCRPRVRTTLQHFGPTLVAAWLVAACGNSPTADSSSPADAFDESDGAPSGDVNATDAAGDHVTADHSPADGHDLDVQHDGGFDVVHTTDAAADATSDGGTDGSTVGDAAPSLGELAAPRPGEWPMFKRNLFHTGLADDMPGAITSSQRCVRWTRPVTGPGGRAAGGAVIARIGTEWTVFVAVQGTCESGVCTLDGAGSVYALRASDGAILWRTRLPGISSADPYAPLVADVDRDGRRELIVPSNRDNHVYALRTETEGADPPGSIQWDFTFDDPGASCEAAPTALDLDPTNDALEIVVPTGTSGRAAQYYAIDGRTGTQRGRAFETPRRSLLEPGRGCDGGDKADSSSPAAAMIGGVPRVYGGDWNGRLYALEWRTTPAAGLYAAWTHELPRYEVSGRCPLRKVRNGPVIAQIIPGGDPEIAFGYMPEDPSMPYSDGFASARLRVLNANGLTLLGDADIPVWKSSPSVADLDPSSPGLEITGGRFRGTYAARVSASGTPSYSWSNDIPDTNATFGGQRSSPAIADIDGDGQLEVIMGIEGSASPGIAAFDGRTGTREWIVSVPSPGVASSPALGDVDGDGRLEIAFLSFDGNVRVVDSVCP